jgi:hypothetical protein
MIRGAACLFSLLACAVALATPSNNGLKNATILLIRHAEKPAIGRELTPEGIKRAAAYVRYFQDLQMDGRPVRPDCLIAGADSISSIRPRLTLEPLAAALGLKLDDTHKTKDPEALADYLRAGPRGKTILISWKHTQIPNLVRALGADPDLLLPEGKWPDDVFCWLIALRYDGNGALIASDAKRINEQLMPGDVARK